MTKPKQPRYYLDPLDLTPETPPEIALECLVRTSGDTHCIARIRQAGGIDVWRLGKKIATCDNFNAVYKLMDKVSL